MFEVTTETLVDTLAHTLAVVKVGTVSYTLAKVEYQALVKKLSARLAEVEVNTLNHKLVYHTAVNILAVMLTV